MKIVTEGHMIMFCVNLKWMNYLSPYIQDKYHRLETQWSYLIIKKDVSMSVNISKFKWAWVSKIFRKDESSKLIIHIYI